jgi:flagellar assembly protein FliH
MSDHAAGFAEAARVPVWTRPSQRGFAARAGEDPTGFARWGTAANETAFAPVADTELASDETLIAQGFAEGLAAGRAAAEADLRLERDALHRLAAGLSALNPEDADGLAAVLAASVKRLVTQIVGEVEISADTLAERCRAVAATIAEETLPARLRLHPTDVVRLDGAGFAVEVVSDPLLAPGTVVLDTASGWVEDGPQVRLERLRAALDKLGAPK